MALVVSEMTISVVGLMRRYCLGRAGVPRGLWAVDRRKMAYSLRDRINTCSTIYDFEQLDNLHNTMSNKHVAVVGGGFLGTAHHPPHFLLSHQYAGSTLHLVSLSALGSSSPACVAVLLPM